MMKPHTLPAIASFAFVLAGCAGAPKSNWPLDSEMISMALDAKVVDCTLLYLATHDIKKAKVHYQYQRGSTTFKSDEPALTAHLEQCAATTGGPDITFQKEIELWTSNEK